MKISCTAHTRPVSSKTLAAPAAFDYFLRFGAVSGMYSEAIVLPAFGFDRCIQKCAVFFHHYRNKYRDL